ncbi:MAG: MFS transporter [Chitinispirillaceae bacterium]|nr:MFS transporter [Chitinispirillaceae bacterium]
MSGFLHAVKKFPRTFWVSNSMEIMERWAWYGLFAVLALYLTNSTDEGALGFSQAQKGTMMGVVTALLYLLPLITGAIADRFGYKKVLIIAYFILTTGYFMMGKFTSYPAVFFAFLYVALGAALFKPVISASIAKTTDTENASIGFGIFYMMVNIGAFIGPFIASKLRNNPAYGWDWVFYMCAAAISVNFILVAFFYKDPSPNAGPRASYFNPMEYLRIIGSFVGSAFLFVTAFVLFLVIYIGEIPAVAAIRGYRRNCFRFSAWVQSLPIGKANRHIFDTITSVFRDQRFILFLLIIVGFWTGFNQLFYTLPNFIDQWGDTTIIYKALASLSPALANLYGTSEGTVAAEMMINLDALFIILFQVMVSTFVMRFKPLNSIIGGLVVCSIGTGISFATGNGLFMVLGIFIFSFGEMSSSPKTTEYIGRIAPRDKTAVYMGCSFLPMAGGNFLTGFLSGPVYQAMSDKVSLLKREVAARGLDIPAIGSTIEESGKVWSQNDYFGRAADLMHMTSPQLTQHLWDTYHPSNIWMLFTAIGLGTAVLLFLYDRFVLGAGRTDGGQKVDSGC